MNSRQKAKHAFDLLEKEMEVLTREQERFYIGGDIGQSLGGAGTATDPIGIYIPIYYGNDMSMGTINGLNTAASNMNSQGPMVINGKYYRVMVAPIGYDTSVNAQNAAGALNVSSGDIAGFLGEASLGLTPDGKRILGEAGEVTMQVDIANVSSEISSSGMYRVIGHELGHLLGLGHSSSAGTIMTPNIQDNSNPILTLTDWTNIINTRGW